MAGVKQNKASRQEKAAQRRRAASRNVFGRILIALQLISSVFLIGLLQFTGMIPLKMIAFGAAVLFFFWSITFYNQMLPKKHGILGKILSLLLICAVSLSSYYVVKANDMLNNVTKVTVRENKMVVAVLKEDPAQVLEDAADYTFGVQYMKGAENVNGTVRDIQEQLGQDIEVKVFETLADQAKGLIDQEAQAIIYNQSYQQIMEQAVPDFSSRIKILHEYKIKLQMEAKANVPEGKAIEGPFSVYISGIDVYGDVTEQSRSDVNIIAVVNPQTHQILLISTPRDYYVTIPGVSGGQFDKLTHAGLYGIETSMATLGALYETNVDYFVRLNFTSMIDIVDTLGGVDVNSSIAFTTSPDSEYVMDVQEGMNHFDGKQALAFSRERQNLPDGDFGRGRNQQAVIEAMLKKMLSPTMLLKAGTIMNTIGNEVETNMPRTSINGFIKDQLDSNSQWSIQSVAAEGTPDMAACYSSGDQELSVVLQDPMSVQNIIRLANIVEEGGTLPEAKVINGSE